MLGLSSDWKDFCNYDVDNTSQCAFSVFTSEKKPQKHVLSSELADVSLAAWVDTSIDADEECGEEWEELFWVEGRGDN